MFTGRQLSETDDKFTTVNVPYYGFMAAIANKAGDLALLSDEATVKLAATAAYIQGLFDNPNSGLRQALVSDDNIATFWGNPGPIAGNTWSGLGQPMSSLMRGVNLESYGILFEFSRFWAADAATDPIAFAVKNGWPGGEVQTTYTIDATKSKALLFGTRALFKNVATGAGYMLHPLVPASQKAIDFGITEPEVAQVSKWLQYVIAKNFHAAFLAQNALNFGDDKHNHYWTTKSVRDHLFTITRDPVLLRVDQAQGGSLMTFEDCAKEYANAITQNRALNFNTCEIEFRTTAAFNNKYGVNTGRTDIAKLDQVSSWRSIMVLPKRNMAAGTGFWCGGDYAINGRRNPGADPSKVDWANWKVDTSRFKKGYSFTLWNSDTLRNVKFDYSDSTSYKGVDCERFYVDYDSVLSPNPALDQSIYGVFNMQCPRGGLPVVFTHAHYHRFNPANAPTWQMPNGVVAANAERDDLSVLIEPYTGKAIKAALKLQLNFIAPDGIVGMTRVAGGAARGKSLVIPMFWMNKNSELTDSNASDLKKVQAAMKVSVPVLIVACVVGPIFLIVGIYLTFIYGKSTSASGLIGSSTSSRASVESGGSASSQAYEMNEARA